MEENKPTFGIKNLFTVQVDKITSESTELDSQAFSFEPYPPQFQYAV